MSEPAVDFRGVSKAYGSVTAVDGLDLTIGVGETVALLGANGAGKSTVVGLMLGLLRPDAGTVKVLGIRPREVVALGRIGVMLQDGGLMPGVTVRGLLGLAVALYSHPRSVERLLSDTGLTGLSGRRVDRLSGGQVQRLRFAVAIAGEPDVLVLDEPTAAMDVESRREFWTHIRAYAASGRTVLFATHYLEEADENADRIVLLAGGRIVTDGTPAEIKAAGGDRTIRFTVADALPMGLDLLPGVSSVELHGTVATLRTADPEATLRALLAEHDRVPDLEVGGVGITDAVLALTH
jgi:ABC-2 type transport system ATP-binding protein